jgi:hypothetical protein
MTRLSNGFSRNRAANLRAALALYCAYYNFCKFHKSIRMKPAMAAGSRAAVDPRGFAQGGAGRGSLGSLNAVD